MDPPQGSVATPSTPFFLQGWLWEHCYAPQSDRSAKAPHCLLSEIHDGLQLWVYSGRGLPITAFPLALRRAGEEEKGKSSPSQQAMLFVDSSCTETADVSLEACEIVGLPAKHVVFLCTPDRLLLRAIGGYAVTLGLFWSTASLRLTELLDDLPPSAALRHVYLYFDGKDRNDLTGLKGVMDALINFSQIDGVGVELSGPRDVEALTPYLLPLCQSMTYLHFGFHHRPSPEFIAALRAGLSGKTSSVKQLSLHCLEDTANMWESLEGTDLGDYITDFTLSNSKFDSKKVLEPYSRILTLRLYCHQLQDFDVSIMLRKLNPECSIRFLSLRLYHADDFAGCLRSLAAENKSPVSLAALRLLLLKTPPSDVICEEIVAYLCSPAARTLEFLEVSFKPEGFAGQIAATEWKLAKSLENNAALCNLGFPWTNSEAKTYANSLLRRNKLYRDGNLFGGMPAMPDLAKLFVCGHTMVGKTTLTRALLREQRNHMLPSAIGVYGRNHQQARTLGIEHHSLTFRGLKEKLLICDLGGQLEFHVFHHYFLNASNNDIFVVVCRHNEDSEPDEFRKQLEYWLRFIVSHRRNHTKARDDVKKVTNVTRQWISPLCQKFSEVLFLVYDQPSNQEAYVVNAHTSFGVKMLYEKLKSLVEDIRYSAWLPQLCNDISVYLTKGQGKRNWLHIKGFAEGSGKPRLLMTTVSEVCQQVLSDHPTDDTIQVQAALQELHNQGYVIYFPLEETSDDQSKNVVIVDINWFSNKLVGPVLGVNIRNDSRYKFEWNKEDILAELQKQGCPQSCLEEILRYLLCLELCVAVDDGKGSEKLVFPALNKNKEIWFPEGHKEDSTRFFGRRLKCQDSTTHLIPFAVFSRLQVKLYKVYSANNRSLKIGYGWLSFVSGRIGVTVRFGGGTKEAWESKQWVDVLMFCVADNHWECDRKCKHMNDPGFLEANRVVDEIRDQFYATCKGADFGGIPTVQIEEMVLQSEEADSDASSLECVLEKVRTKGLVENYQEWRTGKSTSVDDLLLPSEIMEFVEWRRKVLEEIQEEFYVSSTEEEGGSRPDDELEQDMEDCDSGLTGQFRLLDCRATAREKRSRKELASMKRALERIEKNVLELREDLRQMEREIIDNCSTKLLRQELRKDSGYPKYPYLVDERGKLAPLWELVGRKQVRLHFLCESPSDTAHPVKEQMGKVVTVEWAPWVRKAARALVPTVRLLCVLVRVAAGVHLPSVLGLIPTGKELQDLLSGLGILTDDLDKTILPKAMEALLKGMEDGKWDMLRNCRPGDEEAQEWVAAVLGKAEDLDMSRDFGLRRFAFDEHNQFFWVCERHRPNGAWEAKGSKNPYR